MAVLLAVSCAPAQDTRRYEHVFTLGSAAGLNPPQRFTGRASKLAFGKPERVSPLVVPDSVTVDSEQRVWITDRGAPGVHVFDLLRSQYKFLSGGDEKLPFRCPSGIDADNQGRVYVGDPCSGSIFVFDRDLSFLRLLVDGRKSRIVTRPGALLVSEDLRSIYVADPPRHRVVVFNQEGETVRQFGGEKELKSLTALAAWEDSIYVLDPERHLVQVYSAGGVLLKSLAWDGIRWPSAFAIDPETGLFFLADPKYQLVHVFDELGTSLSALGAGGSGLDQFRSLSSLHVDAGGRVYVVDSQAGKVLLFRETTANVSGSAAAIL